MGTVAFGGIIYHLLNGQIIGNSLSIVYPYRIFANGNLCIGGVHLVRVRHSNRKLLCIFGRIEQPLECFPDGLIACCVNDYIVFHWCLLWLNVSKM